MKVPLVDLKRETAFLRPRLDRVWKDVTESCMFTLGPEVEAFEKEFANYLGASECVALNSGTAALEFALKSLGIGPGDEVITVPNTYNATAGAVCMAGATPVLIDCNPKTHNMDPVLLKQAITKKTRAVIPVHMYGRPCPMKEILEITKSNGLFVVEDAAHAPGAVYQSKKIGSLGDIGCFSFFPAKNIGAFGDGGAIVTNNPEAAEKVRMLRFHGLYDKHFIIGRTDRMHALQAAVLRVKLPFLDEWNSLRRKHAKNYTTQLSEIKDIDLSVMEDPDNNHVYYRFIVQVKDQKTRDALRDHLTAKDIEAKANYPIPLHLQPCFSFLNKQKGSFPSAEHCCNTVLSIPMFPLLKDEEIDFVCDAIKEFFKK